MITTNNNNNINLIIIIIIRRRRRRKNQVFHSHVDHYGGTNLRYFSAQPNTST